MTEAQPDLNQYLQEKELGANLLIYRYSPIDIIRPGGTVTLLSPEQRRLTAPVARYQLYEMTGQLYADKVDLVDLQTTIDRLFAGEDLPFVTDTDPDLPATAELIRGASQQGLQVIGTHQTGVGRWDVDDDETRLVKGLTVGGSLDIMTSSDGMYQEIVNQEQAVVATSNGEVKPDEHPYMWTTEFFEIVDATGESLLNQVPLSALGAVLFALQRGLSAATVKRLLLWPRLSREDLAGAQLVLGSNGCSKACLIESVDDLQRVANLPAGEESPENAAFLQFVAEDGNVPLSWPINLADGGDLLHQVAHGMSVDVDQQGRQLSTILSQLADSLGVQIRRYDRQLTDICDIKHFKVAADGHQIEDFQANSRKYKEYHRVETVFDVLNPTTEHLLGYDLTFNELVTFLSRLAQGDN